MRDILFAIISLLLTAVIHSCSSPAEKQIPVPVDQSVLSKSTLSTDMKIPELYKGMDESNDNKLGGLSVGDAAPNIIAKTSDGQPFNLLESVKEGPIALVFYRGFWCGVCTKHLEALQGEMAELNERGLSVYAITPETEDHISITKDKSNIQIPFIHDNAHKIMDAYKVTYKVTDDYESKVDKYVDVGLAESQGAEDAYLPVPATYLIGKDGKIFYAHYNHDYGKRATAADLLRALASN